MSFSLGQPAVPTDEWNGWMRKASPLESPFPTYPLEWIDLYKPLHCAASALLPANPSKKPPYPRALIPYGVSFLYHTTLFKRMDQAFLKCRLIRFPSFPSVAW